MIKKKTIREEINSSVIKTSVSIVVGIMLTGVFSLSIAYVLLPQKVEANEISISKLQSDISAIQTDIAYIKGGIAVLLKKL